MRKGGPFRLTIRARITLSVALLIALGGGIIVAGLNLFMRYGPVWAIQSVSTAAELATDADPLNAATAGPTGGAGDAPPDGYSDNNIDNNIDGYPVDDFSEALPFGGTGVDAELFSPDSLMLTVPALEIRDASDALYTLLFASIIALLVIVVLGSVAAWLLAGRVLSPLHAINAAARSATPNKLDRRVALRGPRDELTDLSDTLDAMLDRLERAFRAQQLFAANASHELRTPLATEKALLDMLLDGPEPSAAEYRAAAEKLREVNARSIAMGEALLELTSAQMGVGEFEVGDAAPHDVEELLAESLETYRDRAVARDQCITVEVSPHTVEAKPELVGRLLDNLLGNATRHGAEGGEIHVSWAPEGEESVLRVHNAAAPLDPETRERLHEPFVRGGGRVRAASGSGLGLAIAHAVAQAHGGSLRVVDPDAPDTRPDGEGGAARFAVEVRLPLRAALATLAT
ncbi:ATP-binding protein [Leucobacter albus]|uniref:histidine kinase n=1 Tax=Leucobacter albus TaxID=272210 RepID=A0ABW3TS92_9MICO